MFLRQLKKRRKIIVVALSVLVFIAVLNADVTPNLTLWKTLENMSCYYLDTEGVPSADTVKFASNSIFFHETSCKGGLDARQACAVESAARFHPDWKVNVLFTAPGFEGTLKNNSVTSLLETFDNVNFYKIHVTDYAKNTPLEKFVTRALNKSRWPISHASDFMRYLTLYKWGGMYLDLDVVVAKPLGSLARNFAARESDTSVSAGAMAFSMDAVGREVAKAAVRDIKKNFKGNSWGHNGPGVITRVLKDICSSSKVGKMNAASCNGFEVYGPEYFYPIKWRDADMYFKKGRIDTETPYVYHVWNHITQHLKMETDSPYETLAQKFCPTVYMAYFEELRLDKALVPKQFLTEV